MTDQSLRTSKQYLALDTLLAKFINHEVGVVRQGVNIPRDVASHCIYSLLLRVPPAQVLFDCRSKPMRIISSGSYILSCLLYQQDRFTLSTAEPVGLRGINPTVPGAKFSALPRYLQRRIQETVIPLLRVEQATDEELELIKQLYT